MKPRIINCDTYVYYILLLYIYLTCLMGVGTLGGGLLSFFSFSPKVTLGDLGIL